jgi:hypothetical protein
VSFTLPWRRSLLLLLFEYKSKLSKLVISTLCHDVRELLRPIHRRLVHNDRITWTVSDMNRKGSTCALNRGPHQLDLSIFDVNRVAHPDFASAVPLYRFPGV